MPLIEIITKSAEETKKIADNLAQDLNPTHNLHCAKRKKLNIVQVMCGIKHAFIIAIEGNLGSGKTTFIQGLAVGLGVKESVLSPTFLILKQFSISFKGYENFYHIDAYRLKNSTELLELGFEDLLSNPENVIVIEWADKIKKILPKKILR